MPKHHRRLPILFTALAITMAACHSTPPDGAAVGPAQVRTTAVGPVLSDPSGMTLYTYKNDPAGVSECYKRCARTWPPFAAAPGARSNGRFTIIERKDGIRQWAHNGKALYTWKKDKKPGDATGHNRGDVWFAARP